MNGRTGRVFKKVAEAAAEEFAPAAIAHAPNIYPLISGDKAKDL